MKRDLKSGDYVLVKFKPVGKKMCYKYVATVVEIISKTEVEVQYFEASDEKNTEFVLVKVTYLLWVRGLSLQMAIARITF